MKNKKVIIGIIAAVLLVLIGGAIAYSMNKSSEEVVVEVKEPEKKKKKITEPTNVIEVSDRPYIKIDPKADGVNVVIVIDDLKKPATDAEYELEYKAGPLLQGAFGNIELTSMPTSTEVLLGSCSAGGACTYHKDVTGGSLLTRFTGGDDSYTLKSDWKYIDNLAGDTEISSTDSKFQLESKDITRQRFIIIFNSPGFPGELEGTVVSEPYSLTASSTLSGTGILTMRAMEEAGEGSLVIAGYDGVEWTEYESSVDGKMVEAEVELVELYVVVRK